MNPYESPQTSLEQRSAEKFRLVPEEEPLPKILLLKLISWGILLLGEIYVGLLLLDHLLVAWAIYGSPLLPGSDHLTPRGIVTCFIAIGLLLQWVWRSMD